MSDTSKWSTAVCPIGLASELACDRWMPIILRDIGLLERRTFNKLLKHNLEGISSGSLATKLKRLEHVGLITYVSATEHKQKKLYHLTESGIDFMPVLFALFSYFYVQAYMTPKKSRSKPNTSVSSIVAHLGLFSLAIFLAAGVMLRFVQNDWSMADGGANRSEL